MFYANMWDIFMNIFTALSIHLLQSSVFCHHSNQAMAITEHIPYIDFLPEPRIKHISRSYKGEIWATEGITTDSSKDKTRKTINFL